MKKIKQITWTALQSIKRIEYTCGYCDVFNAPSYGYASNNIKVDGYLNTLKILICTNCNKGTFVRMNDSDKNLFYEQVPSPAFGENVLGLKNNLKKLYDQARRAMSVEAYSAAVLVCRKILMHVAVDMGAKTNKGFAYYVDYLDTENHITKANKQWVKYIKDMGNHENHKIQIVEVDDAKKVITFTSMLLKIIYEYPSNAPELKSEVNEKEVKS